MLVIPGISKSYPWLSLFKTSAAEPKFMALEGSQGEK